jgi:hypothetical protein
MKWQFGPTHQSLVGGIVMRRDTLDRRYVKVLTTAAQNIYPDIRTIDSCATDPEILIQGRQTLLTTV